MQHKTLWLVSDDGEWLAEARAALARWPLTPDLVCWAWSDLLAGVRVPPRAALWDASRVDRTKSSVLELWASRFLNYCSVARVHPDAASCEAVLEALRDLGYGRVVSERKQWPEVCAQWVLEVFRSPLYLVPLIMLGLGADVPALAQACAAVAANPENVRSVNGWGRSLGYRDRHGIEALFREHGFHRPWVVLSLLRLAAAADWAAMQPRRVSLAEIARRFKYGSPGYLNRQAREITGSAFRGFQSLDAAGLLAVAEAVSRDVRVCPQGAVP
jgi:hypothetical protein